MSSVRKISVEQSRLKEILRRDWSIIVMLWVLFGCSGSERSATVNDTTWIDTAAVRKMIGSSMIREETEITDKVSGCDSLKVADYKVYLKQIALTNDQNVFSTIDKIAKDYMQNICRDDQVFCGKFKLWEKRYYQTVSAEMLFKYGYRFIGENGMQEASSSFFVFGVLKNEQVLMFDIASDLMFEIQLELAGVELKDSITTIWGEMYPYSDNDSDYGKFRLIFKGERKEYQFQCNTGGH